MYWFCWCYVEDELLLSLESLGVRKTAKAALPGKPG